MTVSVIPEAAEVTIGKNGNKHKLKGGGSKATFLGGSVLSFGHCRCP